MNNISTRCISLWLMDRLFYLGIKNIVDVTNIPILTVHPLIRYYTLQHQKIQLLYFCCKFIYTISFNQ